MSEISYITANGIRIAYKFDGPEDAETVVLSNSLAADMDMWRPQMSPLTERFRVLRYDTRGHGQSEVPDGDYKIEDLTSDLLGLLDGLELERVHFVGLSLGGMVGQCLGARHGERIERLVLCDTASEMAPGTWEGRIEMARIEGMEPLVEPTIERWFTPGFRDSQKVETERIRQMVASTPAAGYAGCAAVIRDLALTPLLSQIENPTCVVVGADDPSTPLKTAERIHAEIAGSELVVIQDAAHLPNVERPEAFNTEVMRFLCGEGKSSG